MDRKKNNMSGVVNCLGWCGKQFNSKDRFRVRFCKKCSSRMEEEHKKNKVKPNFCSLNIEND